MLKIETELIEDQQAKLTVEVDAERVDEAMQAAARRIARQVNVPGFRKGKAPYHVIVNQFGEPAVYAEALEELGNEVYAEALDESDLEPYGPGSLDDVQYKPMVLTFTVPLQPDVDLGNYRKIRAKHTKVKVNKDDVNDALEELRDQQAVLVPVERPAAFGDMVTLDIQSSVKLEDEDEPQDFINREDMTLVLAEDSDFPMKGFALEIVGMSADEERTFSLLLPKNDEADIEEDNAEEPAKDLFVDFVVKCNEVKQRDLPKLDNEFATSLGEYKNLKELRNEVADGLLKHKQTEADEAYADEIMEVMVEQTQIQYPPVMLEEWIDRLVHEFEHTLQEQQNLPLDDFLKLSGQTMEELREDNREQALQNLTNALVLGKFVDLEKLRVTEEDIEARIAEVLESAGENAELMQMLFNSPYYQDSVRSSILGDKIRERLVAVGTGKAPSEKELERAEKEYEEREIAKAEARIADLMAETAALPDDELDDESDTEETNETEDTAPQAVEMNTEAEVEPVESDE